MKAENLFYVFESQDERRAFGGSAFIEIQYCRHQKGMPVETLVSLDYIRNWEDDSLYVTDSDMNALYDQYAGILGWKTGMELFGISYYSCEQTAEMIDTIKETHPADWQTLVGWLEKAKEGNGFYILGI